MAPVSFEYFVATSNRGGSPRLLLSVNGSDWLDSAVNFAVPMAVARYCACSPYTIVAQDGAGYMYWSDDGGLTLTRSVSGPFSPTGKMTYAPGVFCSLEVNPDTNKIDALLSFDDGRTWQIVRSVINSNFVNFVDSALGQIIVGTGNTNAGLYIGDGRNFRQAIAGDVFYCGAWNGFYYMAGRHSFYYSSTLINWDNNGGLLPAAANALVGNPGYFCAGLGVGSVGIYKTRDLGTTWVKKQDSASRFYTAATITQVQAGIAVNVMVIGSGGGGSPQQYYSVDDGETWSLIMPDLVDVGIVTTGVFSLDDANAIPFPFNELISKSFHHRELRELIDTGKTS